MAKILKYVLGLDGANRFDSFYSVGAPAQGFIRYSAVDNRDNHVADEEFDVEFSVAVGIVTLAPRRRVACSAM